MTNPNQIDTSSWFAESPWRGFQQRMSAGAPLLRDHSPYQSIDIYETAPFGKMLVLDGAVQTTQQDEFIYHEMLTLVPLLTHPQPEKVLTIGGGDGGTLRRVVNFSPVKDAYQIELDEMVTKVCLEHLPDISDGAFSHPKARVLFEDGAAFCATLPKSLM